MRDFRIGFIACVSVAFAACANDASNTANSDTQMAAQQLPTPAAAAGANGAGGASLPSGTGGSDLAATPVMMQAAPPPPAGNVAVPGMGQAGTPPPAPIDAGTVPASNSVTITMDGFIVAAGDEVFMCQDFDNPFGEQDVAIGSSTSDMTPGSHHLHVFYGQGTPLHPSVAPCENPNEFRPLLHISTLPHLTSAYDAGTAAKLKGSSGLRLQVHYLNSTDAPIDARVTLTLTTVDPTSVQRWVAQMHFNRVQLTIPPGSGTTVSTSCAIPQTFGPIGLLSAISHMHKRGVHFTATTSTGVALLDTTNWDDPPPAEYATPVMLNPGDTIDWACTYDNTTGNVLTYGDSAEKNEMCIYIARFFSSPNGDDLECETPFPNADATVQTN